MRGLARHRDDIELRYLATRVLARSGATESATACYARFELARQPGVDFAALGARLAKDSALAAPPARRGRLLGAAASAYRRIFARTGEHYPAVNAATLYLLAGDEPRALMLARKARAAAERAPTLTALDRYYRAATLAEAALISRDTAAAQAALEEAARHLGDDFSAAATTRRQLRLVCHARNIAGGLLDLIRPPAVLHYAGETRDAVDCSSLRDRRVERLLADQMNTYLRRHDIGFVYGSLAAGGEILFAEAALMAGAELNVVLPFRQDEFVDAFVRPAGVAWVRRFGMCLERARAVSFATTDAYQGDDDLIAYANRLASGTALLRARHLDTAAREVRIALTGRADAARREAARRGGRPLDVLAVQPSSRTRSARGRHVRSRRVPPRFARAILFGDVKGYSQVVDHLVPLFQRHVMGTIAATLRRFGGHVLYRNSWGDAIYAVIDDPVVGARCALDIQAAMRRADLDRYGFASRPELRLGVHFGPLYDGYDPVCEEKTFFGSHATIAARLEPVAPPGQVYVSEAMAAALALSGGHRLRCDYVGAMPAAKGFGLMPMYALNRPAS